MATPLSQLSLIKNAAQFHKDILGTRIVFPSAPLASDVGEGLKANYQAVADSFGPTAEDVPSTFRPFRDQLVSMFTNRTAGAGSEPVTDYGAIADVVARVAVYIHGMGLLGGRVGLTDEALGAVKGGWLSSVLTEVGRDDVRSVITERFVLEPQRLAAVDATPAIDLA